MGYFIKNKVIANESISPAKVSLSSNPNFIEFEAVNNSQSRNKYINTTLNVFGQGFSTIGVNVTRFSIVEKKTGISHTFRGTTNLAEIDKNTFYLGTPAANGTTQWGVSEIANSLKECLCKNSFLKSNFDISIPFAKDGGGSLVQGATIGIKSKGCGTDYSFSLVPEIEDLYLFFIKKPAAGAFDSTSADSISMGYKDVEIELDLYKDNGIFLGEDSLKDLNAGTYVTSLSKSYFEQPIWFDMNSLQSKKHSDRFLSASGWCETGTIQDFRFVAKRKISNKAHYTNDVFYYSSILYSITGYDRNLEDNDLTDYIYDTVRNNKMKPLTHQPTMNYVMGQSQYFNFILSDPNRAAASAYRLGLQYELLSQSGVPIAKVVMHEQPGKAFGIANAIRLDIDSLLAQHRNTGIVKVRLCKDRNPVSGPMTFNVLPSNLYQVNDFAFLNSLGGWSSFNFGDSTQMEFKTTANVYNSTQTPASTLSSGLETVYSKSAEEKFTVRSMPVNRKVADWLKEMSASLAVYELSTKRYVVIDDLSIKHTSKDHLFRIEMKYHYSDSYNTELK